MRSNPNALPEKDIRNKPKRTTPAERNTLLAETNTVLRGRIKQLESELRKYKALVESAENKLLKADRRSHTAEEDREALYSALRVMAEQVDDKKAATRNARQRARKILEYKKIKPPSTLGASRKRKPQNRLTKKR